MGKTNIPWAEWTFNPWRGCTPVGPECENCYAETLTKRWGKDLFGNTADRELAAESYWNLLAKWDQEAEKRGERGQVFIGSLMDVCEILPAHHPQREAIHASQQRLMEAIHKLNNLDLLLLTKRPHNIAKLYGSSFPENFWWGTSVGVAATVEKRVPHLFKITCGVRFLSVEPQIEDILPTLDNLWQSKMGTPLRCMPEVGEGRDKGCWFKEIDGNQHAWHGADISPSPWSLYINWIIQGGESGALAKVREFKLEWAEAMLKRCQNDVGNGSRRPAFFMKQVGRKATYRGQPFPTVDAKGEDPGEWPAHLRVREMPVGRIA